MLKYTQKWIVTRKKQQQQIGLFASINVGEIPRRNEILYEMTNNKHEQQLQKTRERILNGSI